MTIRKIDFPLFEQKVKVTNKRYSDGGYIGIIIGIHQNALLVEYYSSLDGKKGIRSDGWENSEDCELYEEVTKK